MGADSAATQVQAELTFHVAPSQPAKNAQRLENRAEEMHADGACSGVI